MTTSPERLAEVAHPAEVALPDEVYRLVLTEASRTVPQEACGLLVGWIESDRISIAKAIPCENTAPPDRRRNRFSIDPRRLIEEERALRGSDQNVVGFYHSHPVGPGVPSSVDRTFMELWPDVVWLIVEEGADPDRALIRGWTFDATQSGASRELSVTRVPTESSLP